MANGTSAKRQIAYKATIAEINEGRYVKEEGWEPNYIITNDGRKISRANLIAVVVSKAVDADYQAIVLDDGSGKISLRSFGSEIDFAPFEIGDLVLVIGRPREFNEQKYIVTEIIKKIDDKKWIDVRKLELQIIKKKSSGMIFEKEEAAGEDRVHARGYSEEKVADAVEIKDSKEHAEAEQENPYQIILNLIKTMDKGDGVDVQDISIKSKLENAESVIFDLLKEGEIFEIRPGRVKILS